MPTPSIAEVSVQKVSSAGALAAQDSLAVEEPLEIRLGFIDERQRPTHRAVSITMRTPGNDFELAAGFLFTEGIIQNQEQIKEIRFCGLPANASGLQNTVRVDVRGDVAVDLKRLERHFYTTSSCGVCGKTSIAALQTQACPVLPAASPVFASSTIHRLPKMLREAQQVFATTGGLHAAALFDPDGRLIALREDVGRHNAVDKLIGAQLLAGATPLNRYLLLVSGRASFELVQKALMGGVPILAAVGAPSSLAVELARNFGMTVLGFVRDERFNIYCGEERIC
jgi:FdhD protein